MLLVTFVAMVTVTFNTTKKQQQMDKCIHADIQHLHAFIKTGYSLNNKSSKKYRMQNSLIFLSNYWKYEIKFLFIPIQIYKFFNCVEPAIKNSWTPRIIMINKKIKWLWTKISSWPLLKNKIWKAMFEFVLEKNGMRLKFW